MFYVTTRNKKRLNTWLSLFGVDRLPVKVSRPRFQPAGRSTRPILAFDLDASRLSQGQRNRFAAYISRRAGVPYRDARGMVDGWPLKAAGLIVLPVKRAQIK